jgi:hypothetical protein
MTLTITITDPLAHQLRSKADSRKIPVEQFALEILGQAVHGQKWSLANRRRLALIRKQFANELTPEEAAELQELQLQADRHLETLDSELVNDVSEMEKAAEEALHGGTP